MLVSLSDVVAPAAETNVPHAYLPTGMDASDARHALYSTSGASL